VAGVADPRTFTAYDLDRSLDLVTRPDGQSVDPQYDAAGRLAFLVRPAGTTTFAYDDGTPQAPGTGHLASIAAPGGETLSFATDGFLPTATTWSGPVAGSVGRGYDDFLRLATETVDVGAGLVGVGFAYDLDGLLTGAGGLAITRNPGHGLVTATTLGGVTTARSYNAFGELATLGAAHGGSALYAEDVSQRDSLGRITRKVETLGGVPTTTDYGYDLAGRLDTVTVDGVLVRDFTYDANGNRLSLAPGDPTPIAAYDAQDRPLSYQGASYTYTANGELLSRTEGSDVTTYTTDTLGNLTQVTLPDGRTVSYVIDGMNRRVGKQVDGTLVQGFLYRDALNPVAELDGSGAVVARFVYGTRPHVPDYLVKGGVTYRILSDHLGSVRLVVNAADGSIAQQIDYDEFGNPTFVTGPADFQPFGFAGGLYDADTGLMRFGARDYDPEVGRWTAKDPIRFAGRDANLYQYVVGDPVNLKDPAGQIVALIGFAVGGFVAAHAAADAGLEGSDFWIAVTAGAGLGALTGGASAYAFGTGVAGTIAGGAVAGGLAGGLSNLVTQGLDAARCFDFGSLAGSAKEGAVLGGFGGAAAFAFAGAFPTAAGAGPAFGAAVSGAGALYLTTTGSTPSPLPVP
jgi:RHS repeat-associated protein